MLLSVPSFYLVILYQFFRQIVDRYLSVIVQNKCIEWKKIFPITNMYMYLDEKDI